MQWIDVALCNSWMHLSDPYWDKDNCNWQNLAYTNAEWHSDIIDKILDVQKTQRKTGQAQDMFNLRLTPMTEIPGSSFCGRPAGCGRNICKVSPACIQGHWRRHKICLSHFSIGGCSRGKGGAGMEVRWARCSECGLYSATFIYRLQFPNGLQWCLLLCVDACELTPLCVTFVQFLVIDHSTRFAAWCSANLHYSCMLKTANSRHLGQRHYTLLQHMYPEQCS